MLTPAKIKEKIAKKGQAGTFTHVTTTPDGAEPYNSAQATDNQAITFVILPITSPSDIAHLFPTTTVKEAARAYIAAYGLTKEPSAGDYITDVNGKKWTVKTAGRLAPAGIELMWEAVVYK